MATENLAMRALVVNVGVMEANVNLRRMLATASLNYASPSNSVAKATRNIPAAGVATFNSDNMPSALTMLRCSSVVSVTVTLLANGVDRLLNLDVTHKVNSFLMLDDNVGKVVVTNQSTAPVSVTVIQG